MTLGKEVVETYVSMLDKQEFGSAYAFLRKKVLEVKCLSFYEKKMFIRDFSDELTCILELGMQKRIIMSLTSVLFD
ncbi:hypothetical protein [Succinatimonas hippei]|uniref:hypothetical protein n=1 Tax=Succinatimonas hippei TaxID=626938 RepID=UPI0023F9C66D|nr:hypothetical protein [Succinatimonas hippei]